MIEGTEGSQLLN